MLKAEHVKVLRLDKNKVDAHNKLPPPSYSMKVLTSQLAAISDATVSTLLNVDMNKFKAQMNKARQYGVSYLVDMPGGKLLGISAATSLIKRGSVMGKHLILPEPELQNSNGLDKHFIVGVFIRNLVINDYLPSISRVEIAGWLDADKIGETQTEAIPQTFQSKLNVVMVPCSKLSPIATMFHAMKECME